MQSYAIARNVAAFVVTGGWDDVGLSPLARDRFDEPDRWVPEALHI